MSFIQVMLEIPPWVEAGLANGSLIREAAGIIRQAGTKTIVCHLREANPSQFVESACPSPLQVLTTGLQIATIGYLQLRFDHIDQALVALNSVSQLILSELHHSIYLHYLSAARGVARGIEFLTREWARHDGLWLSEAERQFIIGAADIWLHINNRSGEELLESAAPVQKLLTYAALAAVGEFVCLCRRQADERERLIALKRHEGHWNQFRTNMASVLPPTRRFPTRQMLHDGMNPWAMRKTWDREASAIILRLENEESFQRALTQVDQEGLPPSHSSGCAEQTPVICLLLPERVLHQPTLESVRNCLKRLGAASRRIIKRFIATYPSVSLVSHSRS